ncbi:MAG: peptide transporter [Pedosphaera sp.]|nr:peptide transporter [Pedosphaera sp.]
MKKTIITILIVCGLTSSYAQRPVDPDAPLDIVPKTPEKNPPGRPAVKKPLAPARKNRSPRDPSGDAELIPKLAGLIIVSSDSQVKKEGAPAVTGLVVRDVPLLQGKDFTAVVAPYLGKPVSENKIRDLEDDIVLYCRSKNRPLVDVILLDQNIENGVLQLWLLEGRIGKVTVENEGSKWFKDSIILSQVSLQTNSTLDATKLQSDLDWVNHNPFREVSAQFKQGEKLGQSDVVLQVHDQIPLRGYVGYEDSGTKFTGEDRLLAGFNWGNVFGLDHQLNYQYTTDTDFRLVQAHSLSYVAPLPWRNTVTFFGSYVDAKGDFGSIAPGTVSKGKSYQASMRYEVPLPNIGKYQHELSAGFDFKKSNNNLEFGGNTVSASDTHVAQFELGYSAVLPDAWGETSGGIEGYYSPGGLTPENDDAHFNGLRVGARAEYVYGRFTAQRVTRLPFDFSWVLRGTVQAANHRLLPSEQLGLGGYNTIRGYDERFENGDDGWIISNELRSPALKLGSLNFAFKNPNLDVDYLQFLAFFDYGSLHTLDRVGGDPIDAALSSVGGGLRYTMGKHLVLRFDYGYELSATSLSGKHSRAHIGVVGSF